MLYYFDMIEMTVKDIKAQLSKVVKTVMQGEIVYILEGQDDKPVARIEPIKKQRELGTWANKGTFTEVGDGKITLEEFFGVKSLNEIEPLP